MGCSNTKQIQVKEGSNAENETSEKVKSMDHEQEAQGDLTAAQQDQGSCPSDAVAGVEEEKDAEEPNDNPQ